MWRRKLLYLDLWSFFMLFSLVDNVNGSCGLSDLTAGSVEQTASMLHGSSVEQCTWNIKPSRSLSSEEYLEIKWTEFKVNSAMPSCSGDYVDVFVTSYSYSLGKLCSQETSMVKPFNMYSFDGFASIKFKLDMSLGAKIAFTYGIKKTPLPGDCSSFISLNGPTGLIVSPSWPKPKTRSFCGITSYADSNQVTRFIFMDFDLPQDQTCSSVSSIYLQIRSGYLREENTLSPTCGWRKPFIIETKQPRSRLSYASKVLSTRGFVVGVIKYNAQSEPANKESERSTSLYVGISIAIIILVFTISFAIVAYQRRWFSSACRRRNVQNMQAPPQVSNPPFVYPTAQGVNSNLENQGNANLPPYSAPYGTGYQPPYPANPPSAPFR